MNKTLDLVLVQDILYKIEKANKKHFVFSFRFYLELDKTV